MFVTIKFPQQQAIKYLERMLIQAQNQNERSNNTSNTRSSSVKQEDMKILDEDIKPGDEQSHKSEPELVDSGNKNLIKIKDDDGDDVDDSVDDINIDPRTYCKLGHFHLLLEDYPKGIHHRLMDVFCAGV